jgi:hypothetical protein
VHDASGRTPAPQPDRSDSYLRIVARGPTRPLPAAVTCGVFAIYFLVEAFEPFSVFRLVLGIATAALTVRLANRGTLVASKDGIRWHTVMRTSHWPYEAVDHFELAVRPRTSGPVLRVMRIHLTDGRAQWLGALVEPPEQQDEPHPGPPRRFFPGDLVFNMQPPRPLDEVVVQLNRILYAAREIGDAREAS